MAEYLDREAFIPYRRSDLIELCLKDGKLADAAVPKFRELCEILSAYYHFQFHRKLERLKDNYARFDPDTDTKSIIESTPEQQENMVARAIGDFQAILERANYRPISQEILQQAFTEASLIELETTVDFEDFDQMVCYYRGDIEKSMSIRKLFKTVEQKIEVFERVVLLIKFKDAEYFAAKQGKLPKAKKEKLNFNPGKMYLYLYKNIPKFDLEFLFPNIKASMTLKDRILLGMPAIGAAIPIALKILPKLLLIIGAILLLMGVFSKVEDLSVNEKDVRNVMSVLVASLSLTIALGGFGFKQYTNYKNRLIKFQKDVMETLFFKNLASNASVFQYIIDAAEEEECKEILLVYYHLMTSNEPLTPEQLDDRIEKWMEDKFGTKIDFDINNTLRNLEAIRGKIVKEGAEAGMLEVPLVTSDEEGYCQVLSLDEAKTVIDYVWDNAFQYA
ncbi:MAG: TMEM143 family protein [Hormoscilla sp.]